MFLLKEIKELFTKEGYLLEPTGISWEKIDDPEGPEKEFYNIKVYLANGQGLGVFYIPRCSGCFEDADILIWIREQFYKRYPELFTETKEKEYNGQ